MNSLAETIDERLTEIESSSNESQQHFAIWLSAYIAEHEETEIDPSIWTVRSSDDGSLYPLLDVDRFVVETERGWRAVEVEFEEAGAIGDEAETENGAELEHGSRTGYVYGEAGDVPTWVIYAWKAYSGQRYVVESRDSFVAACVCAKQLGPYR